MTIGAQRDHGRTQMLLAAQRCEDCGQIAVWYAEAWRLAPAGGENRVCGCGKTWGSAPVVGRPEGQVA